MYRGEIMKKICVDKEKCIGCGACEGMEPDVFELGDDGFAESIKKDSLKNLFGFGQDTYLKIYY